MAALSSNRISTEAREQFLSQQFNHSYLLAAIHIILANSASWNDKDQFQDIYRTIHISRENIQQLADSGIHYYFYKLKTFSLFITSIFVLTLN